MVLRCPHEQNGFVLRKESRVSSVVDGNREFKSAFRLVKELPISVEAETNSFVILHHVFDGCHIMSLQHLCLASTVALRSLRSLRACG
jgi:hypothetical protein